MKNTNTNDSFEDIPERIPVTLKMNEANESISIHKGTFTLKNENVYVIVNGEITFEWFPHPVTIFRGEITFDGVDNLNILSIKDSIELIVKDFKVGNCYIRSAKWGRKSEIEGVVHGSAIFKDSSIRTPTVSFSVPNLKNLHGEPIKDKNEKRVQFTYGRLTFDNNDYIIILDKFNNYNELKDLLKYRGSYIILYNGIIKRKKVILQKLN